MAGQMDPHEVDEMPKYDPKAIEKEVRSEALTHPVTLACTWLAAAGVVWALGFSFFFGGFWWGLALGFFSGIGAIGSILYHYFGVGEAKVKKKVEKIQAQVKAYQDQKESEERRQSEEEVSNIQVDYGEIVRQKKKPDPLGIMALASGAQKEFESLIHDNETFEETFSSISGHELLVKQSMAKAHVLARATYGMGLNAHRDILVGLKSLGQTDILELQQEREEITRAIADMTTKNMSASVIKSKQDTLKVIEGRFKLIEDQKARIQQQIEISISCSAALEKARLQIPLISASAGSVQDIEQVTSDLSRTLDVAQKVKDKLMGNTEREEDEMYLRHAQEIERSQKA